MANKEIYDNLCKIIANTESISSTLDSIGLNAECTDNGKGIGDKINSISTTAVELTLSLLNYNNKNEDEMFTTLYLSCITNDNDKLNEIWDEYGIK